MGQKYKIIINVLNYRAVFSIVLRYIIFCKFIIWIKFIAWFDGHFFAENKYVSQTLADVIAFISLSQQILLQDKHGSHNKFVQAPTALPSHQSNIYYNITCMLTLDHLFSGQGFITVYNECESYSEES